MATRTIRRMGAALALGGGLLAAGGVAAVATGNSGPGLQAAASAPAAAVTTLQSSYQQASAAPATGAGAAAGRYSIQGRGPGGRGGMGGLDGGFGGRGGGMGMGRSLTVTGVTGNTITATARGSQAVTVTVSATTVYTEAGASATLSDVTAGEIIAVRGTRSSEAARTISATGVTIVLPTEVGVVTAVNGSTLTMTGFNGATRTVTVDGTTRYQKAGAPAALTDIATGAAIVAEGKLGSDGVLTAKRVTIQLPRAGGQVTAVNGSSYTVTGRGGAPTTITTSGATTYGNFDGTAATAATIKVGSVIMAEGTLSADGKTLTAQRVTIAPAGMGMGGHGGRGHGGRGGWGGPGGNDQDGAPIAPNSAAPTTGSSTSGV